MAYIQSIDIKGYQSHVASSFTLSPGLTVITGPTDSGKTAIIRALRWVVFGEPAGEDFINKAVGEALVQIVMSSGIIVTKNRRKGKTAYGITYPDNTIQLFEKAEVPEEVIKTLGITKQSFGDIELALNFAYQLEAPFLISEPASAGAKVLGKIAGTEVVDLAFKSVAKDRHAANQERLQSDKEVERITEQLEAYVDLDMFKDLVESCELLLAQFDEAAAKKQRLRDLKDKNDSLALSIGKLSEDLAMLSIVPDLLTMMQEVDSQQLRLVTLAALLQQNSKLDAAITDYAGELSLYLHMPEAAEEMQLLDVALVKVDKLLELEDQDARLIERLRKANQILDSTKDIDIALADVSNLDTDINRLEQLKNLYSRQQNFDHYILQRQQIITDTSQFVDHVQLLLSDLPERQERYRRMVELQSLFQIKDNTYRQASVRIPAAEKALADQEQVLRDLWSELKVCPLCEQPILKGDRIHGH
ncbi:hypothetical protein SRRS_06900 [Sporomusa rhizae]|uniref:AAA family ATPase n=1 Tax=Sporomusa rhizae TaxID=357999 RepID=UPI00352AF2D7